MFTPSKVIDLLKIHGYKFILLFIIMASFAVRAYNLDYNTPFGDEAIYVVVGKFGLFQGDWITYSPASWVAGLPMAYPSITAIAYTMGGIVTSRLVNVILGVLLIEAIFTLTTQLYKPTKIFPHLPGIIAAIIVAIAGVGLYISRLATYDMPSFYFLVLGLVMLHKAYEPKTNVAPWYFSSALSLILAFLIKIIAGIYIPLIIAYSFWMARRLKGQQLFFWKRYFLGPLLFGLSVYAIFNTAALSVYGKSQVTREWADWINIASFYLQYSSTIWIFYLVGSIGLLLKKNWQLWATLSLAGIWIFLFHFFTHRLSTLDKHTYLTFIFFSPIIGIGITNLVGLARYKLAQLAIGVGFIAAVIIYSKISYTEMKTYNLSWSNTSIIDDYFSKNIRQGDKILTETGPSIILATYDQNYPINVSTFDWFEYQKKEGAEAYTMAIQEGYFDIIQLESKDMPKEIFQSKTHDLVASKLEPNYKLEYSKDGFEVYKRIY